MKIKTSELTGPALDWVVCEIGGLLDAYPTLKPGHKFLHAWTNRPGLRYMHPSTDWSQGGPIIERECVGVDTRAAMRAKEALWEAHMDAPNGGDMIEADGPTPLIAAMRCFVASRLGAEVDVPEELTW